MGKQSDYFFEQSKTYMPGGVNSPVRAFGAVGGNPLFIKSAKGSAITDADGASYIDYVGSFGPAILGHAPQRVVAAVQRACESGFSFGAPTKREYLLAKLIGEMMPSMEMLRLVNSGTEAVMSAVRLARGYTGRDKIVKFRGCYHGHSDGLLVKAGSGALTQSMPDSLGVPADYAGDTLVAEYNDIPSVEALFESQGDQIAAVIVEPVAANMGVVPPEPDFLPGLRRIADQYKTLLIFDEVITGFRLGTGGATEYYGVTPDLTTLGKIIGGGMPMAAYGGRREIMELVAPLGGVYQAGTLSGNPIATAAGLETLKILQEEQKNGLYDKLETYTRALAETVREIFDGSVRVNRVGSLMSVFFTDEPVRDYRSVMTSDTKKYARYFHAMLENGIYLAPSQFEAMFVSAAHTKEDLERTRDALKRAARFL